MRRSGRGKRLAEGHPTGAGFASGEPCGGKQRAQGVSVVANPEHVAIVKQGKGAITAWREERPADKLDLSNADLRNANLRETNLSEAELWGTIFAFVNLSTVHGLATCKHGGPSVGGPAKRNAAGEGASRHRSRHLSHRQQLASAKASLSPRQPSPNGIETAGVSGSDSPKPRRQCRQRASSLCWGERRAIIWRRKSQWDIGLCPPPHRMEASATAEAAGAGRRNPPGYHEADL